MAPEALHAKNYYTPKIDVFSLACTLVELLTDDFFAPKPERRRAPWVHGLRAGPAAKAVSPPGVPRQCLWRVRHSGSAADAAAGGFRTNAPFALWRLRRPWWNF